MYRNYTRTDDHSELLEKLEEYIKDEIFDGLYYQELSKIAPLYSQRELLISMSNDEKRHANEFMNIVKIYNPAFVMPIVPVPVINESFKTATVNRIIDEVDAYKKYGKDYISAVNKSLADLFFNSRTDENIHAHKLNVILHTL